MKTPALPSLAERTEPDSNENKTRVAVHSQSTLRDLEKDFRWRANQCRTNPDAFDTKAAAIWDWAADAVKEKQQ